MFVKGRVDFFLFASGEKACNNLLDTKEFEDFFPPGTFYFLGRKIFRPPCWVIAFRDESNRLMTPIRDVQCMVREKL